MTETPTRVLNSQYLFRLVSQICVLAIFIHGGASLFLAPSWIPFYVDVLLLLAIGASYTYAKDQPKRIPSLYPTLLLTQIITVFMWFGMGGLQGPGIAVNISAVFIYLLMDNRQRYWVIGGLMVLFTGLALTLEYLYPQWVPVYSSTTVQAVYSGITFICLLIWVIPIMVYVLQKIATEQAQRTRLEVQQETYNQQQQYLLSLKELQEYAFLEEHSPARFESLLQLLMEYTESSYGFLLHLEEDTLEPLALLHEGIAQDPTVILQPAYWTADVGKVPLPLQWKQQLEREETLKKGLPPIQHRELVELRCFPIYYQTQLLGLAVIGRPSSYGELKEQDVLTFLSTYGTVLYDYKTKHAQQRYLADLAAAKEEAEQISNKQKQFFTNISHELRTPLTLVVGPVSALLSPKQDPPMIPAARTSLEMVLRNSKKMLQYVNDIMDLSKLSGSTLELHTRPNHLYSLVKGIYQAFEIQTHYRKVLFELRFEADRDLVVELDAEKLEKIINNLLSNAFKYTADGGTVTWTIACRNNRLHMAVEDTGVGIAPADLPHVFERFYQTENAHQIATAGTGVGLALAKELTELQGGNLQVESIVNKGTRFFFDIPLIQATVPTTATVETGEQDPNRLHILLVEDNRDMAGFIQLVLKNDYNITIAYNGAEGWKCLQENQGKYQLLITDLMMPEMDGFELLRRLKATDWGSSLPTIVLTARADAASKIEALTIGIDEYLTKPFAVEELTLHVRNLMENAAVRQTTAQAPSVENDKTVTKEDRPRLTPVQREKINRAREIVLENLDEPDFGVEVLARSLATSKRQLYRFMQLHTGLTPLKFINEIRLQEARRMLEQGLCSTVKEVSYSIGFLSTRHFSKTYANRFGKKPSEYFR